MKKVTVSTLAQMKQRGEKIAVLTAYDAAITALLNEAQIDVVLVGDSVANVKLGYTNTVPVTMDEMVHHMRAVSRVNTHALLVCDMPYLSYHFNEQETLQNAGRLVKEGGAEMVKVEGGAEIAPMVNALSRLHIPVMGHLGLTPQSINKLGGYRVQGKDKKSAAKIFSHARALQKAGVQALVLECVPQELAQKISRVLTIPTIGIGAGPHCDGQVLVSDDLIGLTPEPRPSFVKARANVRQICLDAFKAYRDEVKKSK